MTPEEFSAYIASLPPEMQQAFAEVCKPIGDYATQSVEIRDRLARDFPKLPPPFRAALSLALARFR
ncbi:MAG TPA: hypothetical protein VHP33_17480 [Polyangiaceae bacterium]|nr:hypothetical protein [Polyangiaceae bacterium]